MPPDLDPLTWDPSLRTWIRAGLFLCSALFLFVAVFLLDPLLPTLSKPKMSVRKALEGVVLGVFLAAATIVAIAGVCIGLRMFYGYVQGLPGAPTRLRTSGLVLAIGHLVFLFVIYYNAWDLVRMPRLIERIGNDPQRFEERFGEQER